ncbi:hypothetical protein [Nocardia sp. NPDC059239]|uniref:hypothetical protein n=1 Tax=unclassified Nocardia TaxID=2637762 RepID=UPI0036BCED58
MENSPMPARKPNGGQLRAKLKLGLSKRSSKKSVGSRRTVPYNASGKTPEQEPVGRPGVSIPRTRARNLEISMHTREEPVTFGPALGFSNDAELVTAVAAAGFKGQLRVSLEHQLWLYGWRVLRAMVRDLSILRVHTALPPMSVSPDDYTTLHNSAEHREELVIDTLALAVPFMVEQLRKGRWDPQRSATLGTYFITACAIQFRDSYRSWHKARVRQIREGLAGIEAEVFDYEHRPDPYDVVSDRFRLHRILKTATLEERFICMGILADRPRADIAEDMGITEKALEGRMYRLRQRAWKNLGAAPIRRKQVSA